MNEQIVIIGGGRAGTLAANRLRTALRGAGPRVVVIDRTDPRDQELGLLVALGIYGPGSLQPPEHLQLREGVDLRLADAATVDTERKEVFLTDGTTVPYDVLVLATGRHRLPATADGGRLPVAASRLPSASRADVFTLLPAGAGSWPAVEQPIQSQVEYLVSGVRRYLDAGTPLGKDVADTSAG
ncbi:Pyridine nucleotide-disulphide oxidoreductase [Streptomyces sp. DvalAA-14]|uniref:FAD-dependent oxidoreductase n=1 Tax=unclassified Streptomyces TaxID=2593676 RepID=UPI00081AFBA4|nr:MULTISPECIES: FAD-dependent oxidoreductase [unclassified Streptomyces]MYS22032.1 FAD-dependent oxidoreductase [Streptomyces sp. SID4948]SCE07104.1 Pyridine nucleotide-disulphide oxidoreductase [Streptomyces sp. DvalAA-14]